MSLHKILSLALLFELTSICTAQSDNYTYFNVSGCLALFARSISVKFVNGKTANVVPIPSSSLSLSPISGCTDIKSVLVFTSSNVGEVTSLNVSMGFSQSGRYWSLSDSSLSIVCQGDSKYCINVPGNPLSMKWAEAPLSLGYKCTKPPVASAILPAGSGNSVSIQFSSLQVQPFGVKNGVFGDVTDCVGYFSIGVWSSLIVSILLVSVLTYGLVMLTSVQPNEIYEDPKKKMIQLGADN
ncbi:ATPase [Schistosoma japonicum]|uniref:ATPase, H+ transporting, lysosomal accessory protein 1 n=1 Tax=Schistosoma japonicum TaxID=6182 RepID=C1LMY9_SCHJA|nr:ATPase [Schistosoma japonicum]CAX76063.1 ATPase, H+ transporting, lysosomal accessory protein 4 [Schistosoma japonicum]CAX76066.1 ATPase, H+ transporting, lysosomal accessory protein 5 [Schistosoma japonicum]CAX76067.1 ATPase, H+ transporting, lysosomal accessory protein 1 [Schistosoma japonicum]